MKGDINIGSSGDFRSAAILPILLRTHDIFFSSRIESFKMNKDLQNELINFMFLRRPDGSLDVMGCLRLWFGKSTQTDIEIRTRFGEHVDLAF